MISCTEFIPLYSEFFKFLEEDSGHEAVLKYWHYLSDKKIGDPTNPNSLKYKCEKLGGFEGAVAYWNHTLSEEACDLLEIVDREKGYKYLHMRHCPSRGRLNSLSHIEPYYDYCEHCKVIYSIVLEPYGIVYERDHSKIDNAECFDLLYRKGEKPFELSELTEKDIEKMKSSPNVQVRDMKEEDNKYLHRDFHISCDMVLRYCGEIFGEEALISFLDSYARNFYSPVIKEIKANGLSAVKEWFENIYKIEEAEEVLHTELKEGTLTVVIDKCPAIEHMRSLNQKPSDYFIETTRTLYNSIAEASGLKFSLEYYDENGAAKFTFVA